MPWNLGQFHCFLDIPASSAWSFLETTEAGLWHMLYGDAAEPINPEMPSYESQALIELGKTLKIYLWRALDHLWSTPLMPKDRQFAYFHRLQSKS
jgi:hypothetical protein